MKVDNTDGIPQTSKFVVVYFDRSDDVAEDSKLSRWSDIESPDREFPQSNTRSPTRPSAPLTALDRRQWTIYHGCDTKRMSLGDDPPDLEGVLPVIPADSPPVFKDSKSNAATGASAAGVRAFTAQAVAFYFRAPVKAFFRTRVDYLVCCAASPRRDALCN